jgi:hypothetical protein
MYAGLIDISMGFFGMSFSYTVLLALMLSCSMGRGVLGGLSMVSLYVVLDFLSRLFDMMFKEFINAWL